MDFESLVQATYECILTSGDIAIDVGAHVGRHTIPMAKKVFPHGRVFAFEPLPMCREKLREQIAEHHGELSNLITTYPYALSDYHGEAEFVVAIDALAYSGLKQRVYDTPTSLGQIPVVVRRLDSVVFDLPSLKYMALPEIVWVTDSTCAMLWPSKGGRERCATLNSTRRSWVSPHRGRWSA